MKKIKKRFLFTAISIFLPLLTSAQAASLLGTSDAATIISSFAANIPDGTNYDKGKSCKVIKYLSADRTLLKVSVSAAGVAARSMPFVVLDASRTTGFTSNITQTSPMPITALFRSTIAGASTAQTLSVDYNDDAQSDVVTITVGGHTTTCDLLIEE